MDISEEKKLHFVFAKQEKTKKKANKTHSHKNIGGKKRVQLIHNTHLGIEKVNYT